MFGRKLPLLSPYIRFALHIPDYTKCHHVVISHDESNSLISSNYAQIRKFFFFYHFQCCVSWFSKHRIVLSLCSEPPSPLREPGGVCTQTNCARPHSQPSQLSQPPPPT